MACLGMRTANGPVAAVTRLLMKPQRALVGGISMSSGVQACFTIWQAADAKT